MTATLTESYGTLREINGFMKKLDPLLVQWSWFDAWFSGLSTLGTFAGLGIIVQKFTANYAAQGHIEKPVVLTALAVITAYFIGTLLVSSLKKMREGHFNRKLELVLDTTSVKKTMSLDTGRLNDPAFIELKETAQGRGFMALKELFNQQKSMLAGIIGIIASITIFAALDPLLILLAFIPVIPRTIQAAILTRKERDNWKNGYEERRYAHEYEDFITRRNMVTQSRLFQATEYFFERWNFFRGKVEKRFQNTIQLEFKTSLLLNGLEILIISSIVLYIGRDLLEGKVEFVKLFFFFGSVTTLQKTLSGVSEILIHMEAHRQYYLEYKEFLDTKPMVDEKEDMIALTYFAKAPVFETKNVSFTYPLQQKQALHNCTVRIEANEKIAIVGKNGCGKTTLLRLLSKMYLPTEGTVLMNDVSSKHIFQNDLLRHILYITQDSIVPEISLAEALTTTSVEKRNMVRLRQAAVLANSHDFIEKLAQGYDTVIGTHWKDGVGFSSGQLQRLKLTAAFYRLLDEQVHVGMFDEPMSHCDGETKRLFYQKITELEKTIIVVAHDPAYLHYFKRVLVIDEGTIVQDLRSKDSILAFKNEALMLTEEHN